MGTHSLNALKQCRKYFPFGNKDLLHYFPSHMAKGMNQLQGRLKDIDCIIEVHDARVPFCGRNPYFTDHLMVRPHIMLLNKVDLADLRYRKYIEAELKEQSPSLQRVLYTNCKEQTNHVIKKKLIPTVLELLKDTPRYHREDAEDYNLMVIGIPNVGKSSFINALRRTHLKKGGRATQVGAKAGITRSVLEKIKVSEAPKVYLFDSPGILAPNIPDMDVGMKLALCGSLQDHMVGEEMIADYMLFWMNKHEHFKYVREFNLDEPTDDIQHLLFQVAKERNIAQKRRSPSGGYVYKPNFNAAAQVVLRMFRNGGLGKVNLDQDKLKKYKMSHENVNSKENIT